MYHAHLWESLFHMLYVVLKMVLYQVSCLDSVAQKRHREKLSLLCLNEDEDPYQSMSFVDDMTLWPPVSYGDIFCYFIDRPGIYTRQQLLQWRSLEAYQSGYVRTVKIWASKGDVCVIKTLVNPSHVSPDKTHHAWVGLKKSGEVVTAHCSCVAG